MAGVPLPLSLNDIELYPASRTILIDRIEFDAAILALDDARRDDWAKEQKRNSKKNEPRHGPGLFYTRNK